MKELNAAQTEPEAQYKQPQEAEEKPVSMSLWQRIKHFFVNI